MKTTVTKILFISMLLSTAVSSILFSKDMDSVDVASLKVYKIPTVAIVPKTRLCRAIDKGNVGKVKEILKKNPASANVGDEKTKPLMVAAGKNRLRIVELLIKSQANVNFKSSKEASALTFAVSNNHLKIARLLLEAKADYNDKDTDGLSLIQKAKIWEQQEMFDLLQSYADEDDTDNDGHSIIDEELIEKSFQTVNSE